MSLYLLSSSWQVLEGDHGENFFYNPDVDKAAFTDTLKNVEDTTAYTQKVYKPLLGSMHLEILNANMLSVEDYFVTISTDDGEDKIFQIASSTKKRKTNIPEWGEGFDIPLNGSRVLLLNVFRQGLLKRRLEGRCIFSFREYCDGQRNKVLFSLHPAGELKIAIQYNSVRNVLSRTLNYELGNEGDKIFGFPILANDYTSYVPYFVVCCLKIIEEKGFGIQGIYRVSGRQTEIKSLQAKISTANSRHRDINLILEEEPNIHNISGLLKGYFRDLPQKLLNAQIYDKISAVVNLLNRQSPAPSVKNPAKPDNDDEIIDLQDEMCKLISDALAEMGKINSATAYVMFEHLYNVEKRKEENKMTYSNLGVVWGPNLLDNPSTQMTMRSGTTAVAMQSKIVQCILHNWERVRSIFGNQTGLFDKN